MQNFGVGSGAPESGCRSWGGFHPLSPSGTRQTLPFMCVKWAHTPRKCSCLSIPKDCHQQSQSVVLRQKESTFCPSHERKFGKRTISVLHKNSILGSKEFSSFNSFAYLFDGLLAVFWQTAVIWFDPKLWNSRCAQELGRTWASFCKKLQEALRQSDTKCTSQPYLNFTLGFLLLFNQSKKQERLDSTWGLTVERQMGAVEPGVCRNPAQGEMWGLFPTERLREVQESPGNAGAGSVPLSGWGSQQTETG